MTTNSERKRRVTAVRSGIWGVLATNALAKLLVLGLSGALGLITARLIITNFGVDAFTQYGLLVSLVLLVPFADLGMAAAVFNAVGGSASVRTDPHVRATIVSAWRVLTCAAVLFAAGAVVIQLLGAWPILLGSGLMEGGSVVAMLCMLIFAIRLPIAMGQRILTGLGKNHWQILIDGLAGPLMFVLVVLLVWSGDSTGNAVPVLSYISVTVVAVVALVFANRLVHPQLRLAAHDVPRVRTRPGARVFDVAGPQLVMMMVLPIAMQSHRLLLSHLSTVEELAQYNLAAQLFGLVLQTIVVAGMTLWPFFAKARARSEVTSPFPLAAGFVVGSVAVAVLLVAVLPVLVPFISDGQISLDAWLIGSYVCFLLAQAAVYPIGMYMTDARGLRFQVIPVLVLVPLNVLLSWILIGQIGAAGPVLASAIAILLCQVIPYSWYVRRDLTLQRTAIRTNRMLNGPDVRTI